MKATERRLLGVELIFSDGSTQTVRTSALSTRRLTGAPKRRFGAPDAEALRRFRAELPCVPLACFPRAYAISLV